MSIYPIISGLALFAMIFGVHIACWRARVVRREMLWLLLLFIVLPAAVAGALIVDGSIYGPDILAAGMICLACSVVYVQTYTAIKEDIPSFRILLYLDACGDRGANEREVLEQLMSDTLFSDKIANLVDDSLIAVDNNTYRLKPAGRFLARTFLVYRRMLGLTLGAG
jgi:hypothetical protein